jgi:2-oxoisovalerate dehydrogenase E1 component subunit alpha
MRKFLESQGWWSLEEEDSLKASQKKAVLTAFQKAEKDLKPSLTGLFTDVYSDEDTPWNLVGFHT